MDSGKRNLIGGRKIMMTTLIPGKRRGRLSRRKTAKSDGRRLSDVDAIREQVCLLGTFGSTLLYLRAGVNAAKRLSRKCFTVK